MSKMTHTGQLSFARTPEVEQDWEARKAAERAKAVEKYGEAGLAPGGRREFDVLDYVINEVVGLDRYGEMLQHRFDGNDSMQIAAQSIRTFATTHGRILIHLRQQLLVQFTTLGLTERRLSEQSDD